MSTPENKPARRHQVDHCLNCGTPLHGEHFCPNCGQKNADRDISMWVLLGDFLRDYFSFDSKFFRTTTTLLSRPGKVPLEFISGQRVRHIPPLRMLIFSSFIMFLIWGWTYEPGHSDADNLVDEFVAGFKYGADQRAAVQDTIKVGGGTIQYSADDSFMGTIIRTDSLIANGMSLDEAVDAVFVGDSVKTTRQTILKQVMRLKDAEQDVIVRYFVGNLSFVILALQPVIALLLWLLYVRHRKRWFYVRHMVFTLYFHAWLLILMTLLLLMESLVEGFFSTYIFVGLGFIYLLLAFRVFYQQTLVKTTLKALLTSAVYCFLIAPIFGIISFLFSFYFF